MDATAAAVGGHEVQIHGRVAWQAGKAAKVHCSRESYTAILSTSPLLDLRAGWQPGKLISDVGMLMSLE